MKSIGRGIALILAGSLLIFFISWSYAQENTRPISIVIDGRALPIKDQRPSVNITTTGQTAWEKATQVKAAGELQAIRLGATEADIETMFGQPLRKELGGAQTTWWIYHQDYEKYWQIAFQKGKVVMLYTNDKNVELNKVGIGSSRDQIFSSFGDEGAKYNDGNLTIEANPSSSAEHVIVANGKEFIKFYLDVHDSNRVSGIRIFDPILLLQGYAISGYKSTLIRGKYQDFILPAPTPSQQEQINRSQESQLFDLVNVTRVSKGLLPLEGHSLLARIAYNHSEDMDKNKYFSHTSLSGKSPFDRMKEGGVKYVLAAENIAMGTFDSIEAHHGLMNSIGHRKNIIQKDFTHLGTGVFSSNSIYFTQKFIKQ